MHNKLTGTPKTISRYPAPANSLFLDMSAARRIRVPNERKTPNTALLKFIISEFFIVI